MSVKITTLTQVFHDGSILPVGHTYEADEAVAETLIEHEQAKPAAKNAKVDKKPKTDTLPEAVVAAEADEAVAETEEPSDDVAIEA